MLLPKPVAEVKVRLVAPLDIEEASVVSAVLWATSRVPSVAIAPGKRLTLEK